MCYGDLNIKSKSRVKECLINKYFYTLKLNIYTKQTLMIRL